MVYTVFGTKLETVQGFDQKNRALPLTLIRVEPLVVCRVKTPDKDGYWALQVGIGSQKPQRLKKPQRQFLLKALGQKGKKPATLPRFLREIKLSEKPSYSVGDQIKLADVLKEGDVVKVTAKAKGKGFTGVVKRWGFAGGPRTHGQSDRERAPGSIGQRTDPGRVWKGKKMAGHSGSHTVTIRNLTVYKVYTDQNLLAIKGLVPGPRHGLVKIKKIGQEKNFVPLKVDPLAAAHA